MKLLKDKILKKEDILPRNTRNNTKKGEKAFGKERKKQKKSK